MLRINDPQKHEVLDTLEIEWMYVILSWYNKLEIITREYRTIKSFIATYDLYVLFRIL